MNCLCCGKSKTAVAKMMQIHDDLFICDSCTSDINALFAQSTRPRDGEDKTPIKHKPSKISFFPIDIKESLDEHVIGQHEAKKVISVAIYNHYKRINNLSKDIQKSNILMIGDSGTGKTHMIQTLAKALDLPLTIADMTLLTAAGYVGQDVESILTALVAAADGDIGKAQRGIIMLDEVDKIAKRNISSSTEKDAGGEGVQQALLKIIEGTKVEIKVEGKPRSQGPTLFDTSNVLFIAAGAFFGLDKILEKNNADEDSSSIGFNAIVDKPSADKLEKITEQDIIDYGFIPEFVGRLPVMVRLHKLSKEDYRRILLEPKNSIVKQYTALFALDNITLELSDEFIDNIVDSVYETKRGARARRTEMESKLLDAMFDINDSSYGTTVKL